MDNRIRAIARIQDIIDCCERILVYTDDVSFETFDSDYMLQDAVIRRIEIIGEAARAIDPEIRETLPQIPWRKIIAMRNLLIHQYRNTQQDIVFNLTQKEIPELLDMMSVAKAQLK